MKSFHPSRSVRIALAIASVSFVGCETAPLDRNGPRAPASATVPGIDAPLIELPMDRIRCVDGPIRSKDGKNFRRDCTYDTPNGNRRIHVLNLDGANFVENAYWHGRLLAKEIDEGSLNEALANLRKLPSMIPGSFAPAKRAKLAKTLMAVYGCYEKKMMKSTSPEFVAGIKNVYRGYYDGMGGNPSVSETDFVRATYTIEMGNYFGGVLEMLESGVGSKIKAGVSIAAGCGGAALKALLDDGDASENFRALRAAADRLKFACSGIVATGAWTADGGLIHARNLEQTAMIHTWNRHPTIFLMNERDQAHKYVAFGTAGLAFPGGISGMNDRGISVSLHQMSTTAVDASYAPGSAAMLPFMQQRILREAGSIDEAIAIVKKTRAFSSWTILVSDGVRQEAASIEVNAKKFVVARRRANDVMGQSNVFVARAMQPLHFHHRYNNLLESYSRLQNTEALMRSAKRKLELNGALNILASHADFYEPTGERAFGRGIARVSNIMSTIVMPNPQVGGGKVWMTVADQLPPNHGYYAGFDVDFGRMSLTPNGAVKEGTYASRPNYERSFEKYHQAYVANNDGDSARAQSILAEAIALAEKDGVDDPAYKYIRARFLLNEGKAKEAYAAFTELASGKYEFHPLRLANIRMYLMRASDLVGGSARRSPAERKSIYEAARGVIDDIESAKATFAPTYPNLFGYVHAKHDLEAKAKMWKAIYVAETRKGSDALADVKLQDVDMSTVD